MSRRIKTRASILGSLAAFASMAACATAPPTQADHGCPDGTELVDTSCIPVTASSPSHSSGTSTPGDTASTGTGTLSPPSDTSATTPGTSAPGTTSALDGLPSAADKEPILNALNRATRQVKAHCGSATDDEGKATGPFGKTTVSIRLSHDGNGRALSVPPDFDGKPTGKCVIQAFRHLQYPPWEGSSVTIPWDVEVVAK